MNPWIRKFFDHPFSVQKTRERKRQERILTELSAYS
jgi:hypothetical protein